MDIWVAIHSGADWGTPHRVENVNSEGKEGSPTVTRDGTLYFFSDRSGGADKNAIYESRLTDGHYQAPSLIPPTVNAGPSDTSPFIAPDGRTLLFYSTREGGFGKADLYVSDEKHGKWAASVNLGPAVNGADSDYNPAVSRDGRQFYFGRNSRLAVRDNMNRSEGHKSLASPTLCNDAGGLCRLQILGCAGNGKSLRG